jgi:AAHS family 4-hydroxybenzoate transporter-like MFS transporter
MSPKENFMISSQRIDVTGAINKAPISPIQWRIFALLFIVVLLDGYDTQCVAFVAPVISKAWGLKPGSFGPIFSAGLFGSVIGSLLIGPLADRVGRKLLILASIIIFTVFTGTCALATSFSELLTYRVLAGIGLGGALVNCLPVASEFSPERKRTLVVSSCLWGFPFGAVFGGLFAGDLMAAYGWQAVFIVGVILPLLLLPFVFVWLPESIRYMTLPGENRGKDIASILNKIDPKGFYQESDRFYLPEPPTARGNVKELFGPGLMTGTLLLWLSGFCSLIMVYLLINWIPTALNQAGISVKVAAMGTSMLSFAGILGNILIARAVGARSPLWMIAGAYLLGAVAVATIGFSTHSVATAMTAIFFTGFFVIGGQITMTAYGTNFYPTAIRSTGMGFFQAAGRIGSLIGPLLGGAVLASIKDPSALFLLCTVPALVVVTAIATLASRNRRASASAEGSLHATNAA